MSALRFGDENAGTTVDRHGDGRRAEQDGRGLWSTKYSGKTASRLRE